MVKIQLDIIVLWDDNTSFLSLQHISYFDESIHLNINVNPLLKIKLKTFIIVRLHFTRSIIIKNKTKKTKV